MSKQITDITGTRVGKLRVISYAGKLNNKPYWNCLCDCGTMKIVIGQSIRQKKVKSCGCLQREYANKPKKMKTGMRFGKLTSLYKSQRKEHWWVLCDCGNKTEVRTNQLFSGHTQSCGCYRQSRQVEANTTHGQSRTAAYVAMKARERNERKRKLDCHWTIEMDQQLRELQPACVVCDSSSHLSIDHVLPISKGYGLYPGNAVILCGSCNSSKHNKNLDELPTEMSTKIAAAAESFAVAWKNKEK